MEDKQSLIADLEQRMVVSKIEGYDKWQIRIFKKVDPNAMVMYNWDAIEEATKQHDDILKAIESFDVLTQIIVEKDDKITGLLELIEIHEKQHKPLIKLRQVIEKKIVLFEEKIKLAEKDIEKNRKEYANILDAEGRNPNDAYDLEQPTEEIKSLTSDIRFYKNRIKEMKQLISESEKI